MHHHLWVFERLAFSIVTACAVVCAAILLGHRYLGEFTSDDTIQMYELWLDRAWSGCDESVGRTSDASGTSGGCPSVDW